MGTRYVHGLLRSVLLKSYCRGSAVGRLMCNDRMRRVMMADNYSCWNPNNCLRGEEPQLHLLTWQTVLRKGHGEHCKV